MNGYLILTVIVHGVLLWASFGHPEPEGTEDAAVESLVRSYLVVVLVWGVLLLAEGAGAG